VKLVTLAPASQSLIKLVLDVSDARVSTLFFSPGGNRKTTENALYERSCRCLLGHSAATAGPKKMSLGIIGYISSHQVT
jgi:hypothetical protein